jgi:hypothetical protein
VLHGPLRVRQPLEPRVAANHIEFFAAWFFSEVLDGINVSRLYSMLHTHPRSHRLWSVFRAHDVLAGGMGVFEGATMQHSVYRLLRIPLPRTSVNKGNKKRKDRGL